MHSLTKSSILSRSTMSWSIILSRCACSSFAESTLKPGGRLWIAVPNAGCYFAKRLKDQWHSSDLPVHLQHFTVQSLSLAAEKTGLQIEDCRTESENSLPSSASAVMRQFGVPTRLSRPVFNSLLSKSSWMGKRMDAAGNGEAILLSAQV